MAYGSLQSPGQSAYPPQTAVEARRVTVLANMAGAVLSVALLAGVGLWSYRLMVRDVSGIPVIQALDGPMRISPDNPGGHRAAYQGLAVNTVAADGTAGGAPAVVALAPPSTDLAPEDRVIAAPAAQALVPTPAPMPGLTLAAAPAPDAAAPALVPPGTPGIARSPVPPRRPARAVALAAAAPAPGGADSAAEAALQEVVSRLAAPRAIDLDPASLPAGTRLVQFGAFETDQAARLYWGELMQRFPAYLDGRPRVIEAATAGGQIFYRLRAHGFRDEPEARRFCSVFVSENLECTPVLIR